MLRRWIATLLEWVQRLLQRKPKKMRHYRLCREERISTGFTDVFVIAKDLGDFSAAATTQTWNLTPLAVGDVVNLFVAENPMYLLGGGASVVDMDLGVTAAPTQFRTGIDVFNGIRYAVPLASFAPYAAITTPTQMTARVTVTGANLNQLTQGEIRVWAQISRANSRNLQA